MKPSYLRFISILSELSKEHTEVLDKIVNLPHSSDEERERGLRHLIDTPLSVAPEYVLGAPLTGFARLDYEQVAEKVLEDLDRVGVILEAFVVSEVSGDGYWEFEVGYRELQPWPHIEIDVMESLGILKSVNTGFVQVNDKLYVSASYVHLTDLGVDFFHFVQLPRLRIGNCGAGRKACVKGPDTGEHRIKAYPEGCLSM